jgi:hypothetical protein
MTTQITQGDFEALPMPRKNVPQLFGGSYRVYRSSRDYVVVEAGSALEALERSGLSMAHKIERESMDNISVLSAAAWRTGELSPRPHLQPEAAQSAPVPAVNEDPKETVMLEVAAADAAPAEQPLSNDDVEKLLKN